MLTAAVQLGGARFHPGQVSLIVPFILVAFVIFVGALVVPIIALAVSTCRAAVSTWRGRQRRPHASETGEMHARAMMSELCPYGWRAQITIVSRGQRPDGRVGGVALDWTELQDASGRPAVMRRVWAPTIGDALDAMVADRRTDETLEQIERGAVAEGVLWPDA